MLVTLLGRLAQFVLMFLSVNLMTSLLDPFQLGRVALITASVAFFALFLVNPVGMFVNRRLHTWYEDGRCRYYLHWYSLYILVVACVGAIAVIGLTMINPNLVGLTWAWVIVLIGGSLLFNTSTQTLIPSFNMLGRSLSFTAINLSTLSASLLSSYFFCTWGGASAEHWVSGAVAGQALFTLVAYFVFFRNYRGAMLIPRPSSKQIHSLIHFCWPLAVAVGLQWAHMQGYRFVLADRFGLEELGLFVAGYSLAAAFLSAGETILTTWFQPLFYRSVNSSNKAERDVAWAAYATRMIPAVLLGCTALIASSNLLPRVMLGPQYHEVGNYVLLGCFAECGRMLVGIFGLHAHQHMTTRRLIFPNALGAICTALGLAAAFAFFDLGISSAPVFAALGCVLVILMLWWTGLRHDKYARLRGGRLLAQALALLGAAIVSLKLVMSLEIRTTQEALLAGIFVFMTWLAFSIYMRHDLIGHKPNEKIP